MYYDTNLVYKFNAGRHFFIAKKIAISTQKKFKDEEFIDLRIITHKKICNEMDIRYYPHYKYINIIVSNDNKKCFRFLYYYSNTPAFGLYE